MNLSALCSAQTTVSPQKMLIVTLEDIGCSGEFRIHNPKLNMKDTKGGKARAQPPVPVAESTKAAKP